MRNTAPIVFVFTILVLYALFAEWQYDEAWTYQSISNISVNDIVHYNQYHIANNHVFNSLYFKLLQSIGLKDVFFYRLVSLSCFWLYYKYIFLLSGISKKQPFQWYHLVLFLMPYMVFFSLGRGYGLAIASFTASLYYFRQVIATYTISSFFLFVLFGTIGSIAIFSFVLPFIAMLLFVGIFCRKSIFSSILGLISVGFAISGVLYVYVYGNVVNKMDVHIVGTDSLFKNGMLSGVVTFICLYDYLPYTIFISFKYLYVVTFVLALAIALYKQKIHHKLLIAEWTIGLIIFLHIFLGAKYPLYRSVSYFLPLLYLPLCYIYSKSRKKLIALHFTVMLIIGFTNLFIITRTAFIHDTEDVLNYAAKHGARLVVSDNLNPNIDLYNKLYHQDSIHIIHFETPDDNAQFLQSINNEQLVLCDTFTIAGINTLQNFETVYKFGTKTLLKNKK